MKKKILFNPSAGYKNVLGDIMPMYNMYKEKFDCYIGVKDLEEEETSENEINFLKLHSPKYRYIMYTAEYVFDAGTLSSGWKIMESAKWINLWHGIPIKKMLLDENKTPDSFVNYFRKYDKFISSSEYHTNIIKNSFLYRGEVVESGLPRFDKMYQPNAENILTKLGISKNKKVILYAPTFRKRGEFEIPFDAKKLLEAYGENSLLIVKPHYLNYLTKKDKNIIDGSEIEEINDILKEIDLLITDYSSLIFDYTLLKKPMILFHYDYNEYTENRGFYFELKNYFDDNIVDTKEKLYQKVKNINSLKTSNEKFNNYFLPYENGNSAITLHNKLNLNSENYEMEEIIFLVNQINQIGGVHNFIKTLSKNIKKKKKVKMIVIGVTEQNFTERIDYEFNSENIDIILSPKRSRDAIHKILENTKGTIISLQMWAHLFYQNHIKDKNVILMFHADVKYALGENDLFKWEMEKLANNELGNYKSLVMLTKTNSSELQKKFSDNRRVTYIENGIELSQKTSSLDGNFIFISRLEKIQKNIFELIKIAIELKKMKSDAKIDVFGSGNDLDEFLFEIKKNNLEKILFFKGYAENPTKEFLNSKCHIMVSKMEGLPYTILESQNVGVPTIVYDSFSSAKDLIENDYNGFVIENNNTIDFAKKIDILNKNKEKLKKFSDNSKEKIKNYEYSKIVDKWLNEFEYIKNLEQSKIKYENKKFSKSKQKINNIVRDALSSNYLLYPRKKNKKNLVKYFLRRAAINILKKTYWFNKKLEKSLILDYKKDVPLNIEKKLIYENLITIIIPSYNSEKTIKNTIKSVLNQTYKNLEILVIEDGTKDKTEEIVSKFKDSRIKYSWHKNLGLGLTRNSGIKKAKGDFIFFLDSDDTIPKNSLKQLVYPMVYFDLEVVSGKTLRKYEFSNDNENFITRKIKKDVRNGFWMKHLYNRFNLTNAKENVNIITDTLSTNKLYKKTLFEEKNIWFESGLYEDKVFTIELYNKIEKIGYINRHVYTWKIYGANTSITTHKNFQNLQDRIESLNKIFQKNLNSNIRTKLMDFIFSHDFRIYLNEFNYFSEDEQEKSYNIIQGFLEDKWDFYDLEKIGKGFNYSYAWCLKEKNKDLFLKITNIHANEMNPLKNKINKNH